jgi:OOP family OmpA-OmpF porin
MKESKAPFMIKSPNRKWGKIVPKNNWIIGLGWNAVDDDGKPFRNLFRFQPTWNILPYPQRLTLDRYIKKGWSAEMIFCFNKYNPTKDINNVIITGSFLFFSLDFMAKYDLNQLIETGKWFNPYTTFGIGGTLRTIKVHPISGTINLGLGFNIWFNEHWGLNFQSIAKFAISPNFIRTSSNYLQHSAGVVYKFDIDKKKVYDFIHPRYGWIQSRRRRDK